MEIVIPKQSSTANPRRKAALVVENTKTGNALATALRQAGWHMMLCRTGMQAIDSVHLEPWDVLVIGFRLVDMRGDAVAHAASAERPALARRTLILTDDRVGAETAKAGRFKWLPVSTPLDAIVARVYRLAEQVDKKE